MGWTGSRRSFGRISVCLRPRSRLGDRRCRGKPRPRARHLDRQTTGVSRSPAPFDVGWARGVWPVPVMKSSGLLIGDLRRGGRVLRVPAGCRDRCRGRRAAPVALRRQASRSAPPPARGRRRGSPNSAVCGRVRPLTGRIFLRPAPRAFLALPALDARVLSAFDRLNTRPELLRAARGRETQRGGELPGRRRHVANERGEAARITPASPGRDGRLGSRPHREPARMSDEQNPRERSLGDSSSMRSEHPVAGRCSSRLPRATSASNTARGAGASARAMATKR